MSTACSSTAATASRRTPRVRIDRPLSRRPARSRSSSSRPCCTTTGRSGRYWVGVPGAAKGRAIEAQRYTPGCKVPGVSPSPSPTPEPVRRTQVMLGLSPAEVFAVVTDFPTYPRLFKEMKTVTVLSKDGNRRRVEFRLEMVIAIRYVLDLICDAASGTVDWTYVEGE